MLKTESYLAQAERWPSRGRVILAQFDDDAVVVYQAYNNETADYASIRRRPVRERVDPRGHRHDSIRSRAEGQSHPGGRDRARDSP